MFAHSYVNHGYLIIFEQATCDFLREEIQNLHMGSKLKMFSDISADLAIVMLIRPLLSLLSEIFNEKRGQDFCEGICRTNKLTSRTLVGQGFQVSRD